MVYGSKSKDSDMVNNIILYSMKIKELNGELENLSSILDNSEFMSFVLFKSTIDNKLAEIKKIMEQLSSIQQKITKNQIDENLLYHLHLINEYFEELERYLLQTFDIKPQIVDKLLIVQLKSKINRLQ